LPFRAIPSHPIPACISWDVSSRPEVSHRLD
jgi:hypothetical protein